MKHYAMLAIGAIVATFASAPAQATPYLDPVMWLNAANPGSRLSVFPSHSVLFTDFFGSYTYEQRNNPVVVGVSAEPWNDPTWTSLDRAGIAYRNSNTDAGQLSGYFSCYTSIGPGCLGVYDITFKLDRKIWGFAGNLAYDFHDEAPSSVPFFGVSTLQDPSSGRYFIYDDFFGKIFDTPTDTFTISWRPSPSGEFFGIDYRSFFNMTGVVALVPGNSGGVTPVPEPMSLAIFGVGLASLAAAARRRRRPEAVEA